MDQGCVIKGGPASRECDYYESVKNISEGWIDEGIHDWVTEWMNEWMTELMNEWMDEWMNEWMNVCMNE